MKVKWLSKFPIVSSTEFIKKGTIFFTTFALQAADKQAKQARASFSKIDCLKYFSISLNEL